MKRENGGRAAHRNRSNHYISQQRRIRSIGIVLVHATNRAKTVLPVCDGTPGGGTGFRWSQVDDQRCWAVVNSIAWLAVVTLACRAKPCCHPPSSTEE